MELSLHEIRQQSLDAIHRCGTGTVACARVSCCMKLGTGETAWLPAGYELPAPACRTRMRRVAPIAIRTQITLTDAEG